MPYNCQQQLYMSFDEICQDLQRIGNFRQEHKSMLKQRIVSETVLKLHPTIFKQCAIIRLCIAVACIYLQSV